MGVVKGGATRPEAVLDDVEVVVVSEGNFRPPLKENPPVVAPWAVVLVLVN